MTFFKNYLHSNFPALFNKFEFLNFFWILINSNLINLWKFRLLILNKFEIIHEDLQAHESPTLWCHLSWRVSSAENHEHRLQALIPRGCQVRRRVLPAVCRCGALCNLQQPA